MHFCKRKKIIFLNKEKFLTTSPTLHSSAKSGSKSTVGSGKRCFNLQNSDSRSRNFKIQIREFRFRKNIQNSESIISYLQASEYLKNVSSKFIFENSAFGKRLQKSFPEILARVVRQVHSATSKKKKHLYVNFFT